MTVAPKCQAASKCQAANVLFSSVFLPLLCGTRVYMCKYDFIFVTPTCDPFHWLSLARASVSCNAGTGSQRDYFPVGISKMAVGSCRHSTYAHNRPAIFIVESGTSGR